MKSIRPGHDVGATMPSADAAPDFREDLARSGDRNALASLFAEHEDRLRRWVDRRLDPRLRARVSPSDMVQEVYLAAEARLDHYRERPEMAFGVWVRLLADQRLIDAHRRHLGAEVRNASREVGLGCAGPNSSAVDLAARIADDITSPSQAAMRHEVHEILARAVEAMDPIDREVLSLRHFDELSNDEVAGLLGIPKGTASKRYVRALTRLRAVLESIPGLLDDPT
jgi:RNA polymerase sigma-70 factor (ECF subfamily)